jgi:carbamoyltransferase
MLMLARSLKDEYKLSNLCLAGGVALNCVANGKILEEKIFDNIWVQPAAGDAGGSLGAALAYWHIDLKKERNNIAQDNMQGSYLGNYFEEKEIKETLSEVGAEFTEMSEEDIIGKTAMEISNGKAIGWFQGRMEFGPRALGNRSILGDPRSDKMQKNLNLKVKYRESFRPFAPSVLKEDVSNWFELNTDSPYMLFVSNIKSEKTLKMTDDERKLFGIDLLNIKRSEIPAVTHVDYSARIQTVDEETNKKYHKLIKKFKQITNCPVLINTSFNIRGEPIVNTPQDAFNCFMGTDLDILVIGNCYLEKSKQNMNLKKDYTKQFELD